MLNTWISRGELYWSIRYKDGTVIKQPKLPIVSDKQIISVIVSFRDNHLQVFDGRFDEYYFSYGFGAGFGLKPHDLFVFGAKNKDSNSFLVKKIVVPELIIALEEYKDAAKIDEKKIFKNG